MTSPSRTATRRIARRRRQAIDEAGTARRVSARVRTSGLGPQLVAEPSDRSVEAGMPGSRDDERQIDAHATIVAGAM